MNAAAVPPPAGLVHAVLFPFLWGHSAARRRGRPPGEEGERETGRSRRATVGKRSGGRYIRQLNKGAICGNFSGWLKRT